MSAVADIRIKSIGDLDSLLEYSNNDLIDGFCDSFQVERDEAISIFQEMLKFLWLSESSDSELLKTIDTPILIIDEMWHAFILFTKEYSEFCRKYFGHYLHHAPATRREKLERRQHRTNDSQSELHIQQRERYLAIYDRLGRDSFIKWFYEFPAKFSAEQILKLRIK